MHQLTLKNRTTNFPKAELTLALVIHLLFFSLLTFQFKNFVFDQRTGIVYLGAILESFEAEKIKTGRNSSPSVPGYFSKTNTRALRNTTSTDKPDLAQGIKIENKKIFKALPELPDKDSLNKVLAPSAITPARTKTEYQPYQKLKLYP